MLNKWVGMGRITAPLEVKATNSGTHVLSFSVAVERDYKDGNGERQTDFIDCVAWKQTADFISRYFTKGSLICVEGALNKRTYTTQNGEKRAVIEVIVEKAYFTGDSKKTNASEKYSPTSGHSDSLVDSSEEDLPF